ncbi:hypothetical protein D3C73_555870 [compost metagenome]
MSESVNREGDQLAGLHSFELVFLVIGDDPDMIGHERCDLCADRDVLTEAACHFTELAVLRGGDAGVLQVYIGKRDGSPGALDGRFQRPAVNDDRVEVLFGDEDGRVCLVNRCLGLIIGRLGFFEIALGRDIAL